MPTKAIAKKLNAYEDVEKDGSCYYTRDEGRKSWIIGRNKINNDASAIIAGFSNCPETIEVPTPSINAHTIETSRQGQSLFQKKIKVISKYGFGELASSRASLLKQSARAESLTPTLVLLSTLVSVANHGIHQCDIFYEIIFCGVEFMSNFEYGSEPIPTYVTEGYNFTKIFTNYVPLKESSKTEVCISVDYIEILKIIPKSKLVLYFALSFHA